jgi:two-component system chemotaxis response regulator CheB
MFSTLTERGASATIDALLSGASDYVTKPSNVGSFAAGVEAVKEQLVPKIKALCHRTLASGGSAVASVAPRPTTTSTTPIVRASDPSLAKRATRTHRPEILVIGASTGGPDALCTVLRDIPANFPVAIAIVQHMPPLFTKSLADRLASTCKMPVVHAEANMPLEPGTIYITQGGKHSRVRRAGVQLELEISHHPAEALYKPSVNELFMSASKLGDNGALAVVLTGMGDDGAKGAQELVSAGGLVLAQNMETSVVYGMPRAVVERGIAAAALSPALIAESLNTYPAKAMAA